MDHEYGNMKTTGNVLNFLQNTQCLQLSYHLPLSAAQESL